MLLTHGLGMEAGVTSGKLLAVEPEKLLAQAMGLREGETPFPWQVEAQNFCVKH